MIELIPYFLNVMWAFHWKWHAFDSTVNVAFSREKNLIAPYFSLWWPMQEHKLKYTEFLSTFAKFNMRIIPLFFFARIDKFYFKHTSNGRTDFSRTR